MPKPSARFVLAGILLGIALATGLGGTANDILGLVYAQPYSYTNVPFPVDTVDIDSDGTLKLEILISRCYIEPLPYPELHYNTVNRALVEADRRIYHYLNPGAGDAMPGCYTNQTRTVDLDYRPPPGRYYLEGLADVKTRWNQSKVYWRTDTFQVP